MRAKSSRNAFVQGRASQIWRDLLGLHNLDWAKEYMTAYRELDDPKDRIAALKVLADIFIPKPKPLEDGGEVDTDAIAVNINSRYAMIKAMTEEQIKRECNTSNPSSQSLPDSSPPLSDTELQKLASQD